MSETHPNHPHMKDFEGHVHAVESDLEYFRRKRIDSRVFMFLRRGIISFADLFRGYENAKPVPAVEPAEDLEHRIRALEDSLDAMILEVATTNVPLANHKVAIDDGRRERGDYNPEFRLAVREYDGDLETKIGKLEQAIVETRQLIAAFTRALLDRGEVTEDQLTENRKRLSALGYRNGARIVARAWVDPEFKQRLLETGREAVRELDIPPGRLGKLGVAENTDEVHNIVVCTLCSCYPHDLLGDPPWWYRTDEYKQRIVQDPRQTIGDMFGLEIDPERKVVVHDSTSDVRWMVLPRRPEGTEGMTEEELAELITIDSMVGSAEVGPPVGRDA
ncbi:MAG TPA: nitrile hydratase subunit alpha [Acidimicrobiia bacterium]|nr:nitrile hydratase subunit alpha [Acidimicrobiia bacterium]